jgi:hypothetical protein
VSAPPALLPNLPLPDLAGLLEDPSVLAQLAAIHAELEAQMQALVAMLDAAAAAFNLPLPGFLLPPLEPPIEEPPAGGGTGSHFFMENPAAWIVPILVELPIAVPEHFTKAPLDPILDEVGGMLGQLLSDCELPLPDAVSNLLPGFAVPDRFYYPPGSIYFERLAPGS